MCASLSSAFTWVGAILINIGAISLITWGASTLWPLGFALSALYTIFLFWLASWLAEYELIAQPGDDLYEYLVGRSANQAVPTSEGDISLQAGPGATATNDTNTTNEDNDTEGRRSESWRPIPLTVTLLYGVAVVSFGVTTSLLPINLIPTEDGPDYYRNRYEWVANTTEIPRELRSWAKQPYEDRGSDLVSLAYIEDTQTTLFQGTIESKSPEWNGVATLFAIEGGSPKPKQIKRFVSPASFVTISPSTVCFAASDDTTFLHRSILCANSSQTFRKADPAGSLFERGYIGSLKASSGVLWFKQYYEGTADGCVVYSMNVDTMNVDQHSYRIKHGSGDDRDNKKATRNQATALLWVAAIPTTLISFWIWHSKQIPSMAVTSYAGLTAIYGLLYLIKDPLQLGSADLWFDWWFSLSGSLGLIIYTYQIHSRRTQVKEQQPLKWGLVVTGIAYICGTYQLVFWGYCDQFLCWFQFNLIVVLPILLFGMADGNLFLIVCSGLGWLADAARFSEFVSSAANDDSSVPLSFLVFSIAGVLIGIMGYRLTAFQPIVQEWASWSVGLLDDALCGVSEFPQETLDDTVEPLLQSTTTTAARVTFQENSQLPDEESN